MTYRLNRSLIVLLAMAVVAALAPMPGRAQTQDCSGVANGTPETAGPTDINATSGNGAMSVALNRQGTVTVLRWPSPSFYDQIKYRTTDRTQPSFGALANEGAFLGIAWRAGGEWEFDWLRQWGSKQRYVDDDGDQIRTTYRNRSARLTVRVDDVVADDLDALARRVKVTRTRASSVRVVRVISFANFNPVFSKTPQNPTNDWCTEEDNDEGGEWVEGADAIVHARSGTDASSGDPSGAALAMRFGASSQAHHVGEDTYATGGAGQSAFDDAADGQLSGGDAVAGQADGAISDQLRLRRGRAASTKVFIAAATTRDEALTELKSARNRGFGSLRAQKARWWRNWLAPAALPRAAPKVVTRLAKRSLVTIRQAIDHRRDMIVASIATQPSHSLDWIRDGAYINRALDVSGHPGQVAAHNIRYGELQVSAGNPPDGGSPSVPPGNWAQNYYADGIAGGPIPYEIDETGFGIWTLWDHFAQTEARDYLLEPEVYEAIQRAAHYLSDEPPLGCVDPTTNLQCPANEGDNPTPSQTLVGAQAVWMGLDAAASAARVRGGEIALANAQKWSDRRDELGAAIDANFFDEECGCYTQDPGIGATFLWPAQVLPYSDDRAQAQAEVNWQHIAGVFSGEVAQGGVEPQLLLANAFAWADRPGKMRDVRAALEWVARVPTTNSTSLLGGAWMIFPPDNGPITTMLGQPHVTSHAQFYLAAIKAFGKTPYRF